MSAGGHDPARTTSPVLDAVTIAHSVFQASTIDANTFVPSPSDQLCPLHEEDYEEARNGSVDNARYEDI
jgi:hypothetical protein